MAPTLSAVPDFYQILGITRNATVADIKLAWRKQQLKYHPDRNSSSEAQVKTRDINRAHEVLSHTVAREIYHHVLDGKLPPKFLDKATDMKEVPRVHSFSPPPPASGATMHRQFSFHASNIPTGAANPLFQARPMLMPIEVTTTITFEQSFTGCTASFSVTRQCTHTPPVPDDADPKLPRPAPVRTSETEEIHVSVPPGIRSDEIIVLAGRGHKLDHVLGDIQLLVRVSPSSTGFTRDQNHLVYMHTISLKDALCGMCFQVPHPDGTRVVCSTSEGVVVSPGFQRTFPGRGFKRGNAPPGDLLVRVTIEFPTVLTSNQIIKLRRAL